MSRVRWTEAVRPRNMKWQARPTGQEKVRKGKGEAAEEDSEGCCSDLLMLVYRGGGMWGVVL